MDAVISYLIQMVVPALVGLILWAASHPLRQYFWEKRGLSPGKYREGALLLLFMFLTGLLALTLTPAGFWPSFLRGQPLPSFVPFQGGINLIPVRESWTLLRYYVQHGLWGAIMINFPGNIVMFLPIGFFAGLLMDKPRWWKSTAVTFFLSLFIECFQLLVARGTDVDDLILNTIGGLVGHWLFLLLCRIAPGFVSQCTKHRKGSV